MIADILEADGCPRRPQPLRLESRARGVAAAFAEQTSWTGRPGGDVGVVETDEAAFRAIVERIRPG